MKKIILAMLVCLNAGSIYSMDSEEENTTSLKKWAYNAFDQMNPYNMLQYKNNDLPDADTATFYQKYTFVINSTIASALTAAASWYLISSSNKTSKYIASLDENTTLGAKKAKTLLKNYNPESALTSFAHFFAALGLTSSTLLTIGQIVLKNNIIHPQYKDRDQYAKNDWGNPCSLWDERNRVQINQRDAITFNGIALALTTIAAGFSYAQHRNFVAAKKAADAVQEDVVEGMEVVQADVITDDMQLEEAIMVDNDAEFAPIPTLYDNDDTI